MKEIPFSQQCYNLLEKIPRGKVTTYKEIAFALKSRAYRAVGSAMRKNNRAPQIPCHRVIKSNGEIGNYAKGTKAKINLLEKEGIKITNNKINLNKFLFKFK